ncbi:hypothetical protein T4A_4579, partial [Trichinella pseudospiralis]
LLQFRSSTSSMNSRAVHLHLALWLISILSVKHVRGLLQFRSSTSSMNS